MCLEGRLCGRSEVSMTARARGDARLWRRRVVRGGNLGETFNRRFQLGERGHAGRERRRGLSRRAQRLRPDLSENRGVALPQSSLRFGGSEKRARAETPSSRDPSTNASRLVSDTHTHTHTHTRASTFDAEYCTRIAYAARWTPRGAHALAKGRAWSRAAVPTFPRRHRIDLRFVNRLGTTVRFK